VQNLDSLKQNRLLKSQFGEDEHLLEWFNGYCNGTYLEMGALNGMYLSNTYVFNKALDWKGFLVELSPKMYQDLLQNRPNELATANAAVCDQAREVHYYHKERNGAVSAVWEFSSEEHRNKWWKGVTLNDTTAIECVPLSDLLRQHFGDDKLFFDFFSLDIEGAEYTALSTLDFDRVGFGVILVEANIKTSQMRNLAMQLHLESHGYRFLEQIDRNLWFVNKDFSQIYKDIVGV